MRIVRIILIIGMSYCLIGLNQILQTLPGILGTTRQCCYRCCPILSRCCGRTIDNLVHIRHGQFQTFQVRMQPSSWSIRDTRPILRQGTSVQVRYLSSNSTKTRTQNSPCNPRKKRCTRSGPKTFWLFASCVVVLVKIATNHQHFGPSSSSPLSWSVSSHQEDYLEDRFCRVLRLGVMVWIFSIFSGTMDRVTQDLDKTKARPKREFTVPYESMTYGRPRAGWSGALLVTRVSFPSTTSNLSKLLYLCRSQSSSSVGPPPTLHHTTMSVRIQNSWS